MEIKVKRTSPYNIDLREKVVKYLEKGNRYIDAALVFEISGSAIGRWYRKYKGEGNFKAKIRIGAKRKIDDKTIEEMIKANPNLNLKFIAKSFGISIHPVADSLKRLGYSYKKSLLLYGGGF
jgi:transposase